MKTIATFALALALGAAALAPAQASATGYALTTIENATNQTLHYSVRWGEGEWVQYSLGPGQYFVHSWNYAGGPQTSPPLRVRFDFTLNDNDYVPKEYTLVRYAAPWVGRDLSKRYVFRKTAGGAWVDLFGVN